ncbi:hypothetical protein ACIBH1_45060 [Nonomuraea sp. NPDC050663]|uniref:hypothetical protein n=1 Tax=Nonomuraea sp. NPDC050663 TaxID=3364370 RepID=UPI0037A20559
MITMLTSPSLVSAMTTTGVSTASFAPPEGAFLVACVMSKYDASVALTNTGSALSWTMRAQSINSNGIAAIYTAPAIAQSMTVTGTMDFIGSPGNSQGIALKVNVLGGVDISNPIGATGDVTSLGVQNWTFNAYTSTKADSWGFCAAADDYQTATPTSTDVNEPFNQSGAGYLSGMAMRKASATASAGTAVSFNIQTGGVSTSTRWATCAVEVLAAVDGLGHRATLSRAAVHRAAAW